MANIVGNASKNLIYGTTGSDTISARANDDRVYAG